MFKELVTKPVELVMLPVVPATSGTAFVVVVKRSHSEYWTVPP